jgi:hypothetical protein
MWQGRGVCGVSFAAPFLNLRENLRQRFETLHESLHITQRSAKQFTPFQFRAWPPLTQ